MTHEEQLEVFKRRYLNFYEEASICKANSVKYKRLLVKAQSTEKTKIKRANTLNEKKKIQKVLEYQVFADEMQAYVETNQIPYPAWFD